MYLRVLGLLFSSRQGQVHRRHEATKRPVGQVHQTRLNMETLGLVVNINGPLLTPSKCS